MESESNDDIYSLLTEQQRDTLHEFKIISTFEDSDLQQIVQLLKLTHWDLEPALARFFDGDWKDFISRQEEIQHAQASIHEQVHEQHQRSQEVGPVIPARPVDLRAMMDPASMLLADYTHFRPRLPVVGKLDDNYRGFLRPGLPISFDYKARKPVISSSGTAGVTSPINSAQNLSGLGLLTNIPMIILLIPQTLLTLGFRLLGLVWKLICYGIGLATNSVSEDSRVAGRKKSKTKPYANKKPIGDFTCGDSTEDISFKDIVMGLDADDDKKLVEKLDGLEFSSFNEVYDDCKDNYKYMILIALSGLHHSQPGGDESQESDGEPVALEKPLHSDSVDFLKNVFLDDQVLNFLKENKKEYNFYICDVESQFEGWAVCAGLRIKRTPSIYMIANVSNSNYAQPTGMSVLGGFVRFEKPGLMIRCLQQFTAKFNNELISSRADKHEIETSRKLKEMQDLQYQESLKIDQTKAEVACRDSLKKLTILQKCCLLLEKVAGATESSVMDCTVQIRSAEGSRFILKYRGDSASLGDIYEEMALFEYLGIENGRDISRASVVRERITDRVEEILHDDKTPLFKSDAIEELDEECIEELVLAEYSRFTEQHGISESAKLDVERELVDECAFHIFSTFPREIIPNDKTTLVKDNKNIYPKGNLLMEYK